MNRIKMFAVCLMCLVLVLLPLAANADTALYTATASTNLSLTVGESLSLTATPASVSFGSYVAGPGTATASATVSVVTTANLSAGRSFITTHAWLSSASAGLSGPQNVPSSKVFVSVNGAAAVPCTDTENQPSGASLVGAVAAAGCSTDGRIGITVAPPAGVTTQTDTMLFSLSGASNLIPGSYTGVVNYEAVVWQ